MPRSARCGGSVDRCGHRQVRGIPGQLKGHTLTCGDLECCRCRASLVGHVDRCAQAQRIGADEGKEPMFDMRHRRDQPAVVESRHEAHAHRDAPSQALDQPHDADLFSADGMQSTSRTTPSSVSKSVSRIIVSAGIVARRGARCDRRDLPVAVVACAEQRREKGRRSKRGAHSQSIDPSLPTRAPERVSPSIA